jgi:hypothetical protein
VNGVGAAVSHRHPLRAMIPSLTGFLRSTAGLLPGERFVALSALGVLAVATVFFVGRIGNLSMSRDVPMLAPLTAPSLDARSPRVADASSARVESTLSSHGAEPAAPANETRAHPPAHSRPTVATVRKPDGKAEARTRLSGSIPSSAAYAMANQPPAPHNVRTRWDLLREEVGWCARQSSFFDAVMCEQRARLRWCEDWWGRASECPSGRQADYAN